MNFQLPAIRNKSDVEMPAETDVHPILKPQEQAAKTNRLSVVGSKSCTVEEDIIMANTYDRPCPR